MKATFTVSDQQIRDAIATYIRNNYSLTIDPSDLVIQVRSQQNYRNKEWENGELRVTHDTELKGTSQ